MIKINMPEKLIPERVAFLAFFFYFARNSFSYSARNSFSLSPSPSVI